MAEFALGLCSLVLLYGGVYLVVRKAARFALEEYVTASTRAAAARLAAEPASPDPAGGGSLDEVTPPPAGSTWVASIREAHARPPVAAAAAGTLADLDSDADERAVAHYVLGKRAAR